MDLTHGGDEMVAHVALARDLAIAPRVVLLVNADQLVGERAHGRHSIGSPLGSVSLISRTAPPPKKNPRPSRRLAHTVGWRDAYPDIDAALKTDRPPPTTAGRQY
jgi:hypothetical protein